MRFCSIIITICLFSTTLRATPLLVERPDTAPRPFGFSWPREAALLGTGVTGYLVGKYRVGNMRPAGPEDLDKGDLAVWDRWAAGNYHPSADVGSDLLTMAVGGSAFFMSAWDASRQRTTWRPVFEDLLILGEAMAWSSALNLNVRATRVHPRPFVYNPDAPAAERAEGQASGSFYSGHASEVFVGAVYLAVSYPLRHPEFEHRGWLWAGSLAAATTAATLRVVAGKHFPSDVLAGAAMGTLIGLGFTRIHRPGGLGLWGTELWPTLGEGGAPGMVAIRRF
jgi:membrane-associated phospholipid phosphatase